MPEEKEKIVIYTTRDELMYIEHEMGRCSESRSVKAMSKLDMLEGYLCAAMQRTNWGRIDREMILKRVQELILQHKEENLCPGV